MSLPCLSGPFCPTVSLWSQEKDKDTGKDHSRKEEALPTLSLTPFLLQTLPLQPSDFPASHRRFY